MFAHHSPPVARPPDILQACAPLKDPDETGLIKVATTEFGDVDATGAVKRCRGSKALSGESAVKGKVHDHGNGPLDSD